MTLLVVDPNSNQAEPLTRQLARCGIPADVVSACQIAQYLKLHSPQCVLIYGGENASASVDLCEKLSHSQPRLQLVLSVPLGSLDKATLLRTLRLHLLDVLELPLTDADLSQSLQRLLHRVEAARQEAAQLAELERDQRAGRYIQTRMLPPSPMAIDRYRLHHKVFPSLLLSGDFIDYFRIADSHFIFYMADVAGHGASSAFVTVLLKNFSRRLRREYHPRMLQNPGEILRWLNAELLETQIDKHVAMILGVVDIEGDHLSLVNAGHFPLPILAANGDVGFLQARGKPVGLFEQVTYEVVTSKFGVNDQLLLVSDGVLEILPAVSLSAKEQLLLDGARQALHSSTPFWQVLGMEAALSAADDMSCLTVSLVG